MDEKLESENTQKEQFPGWGWWWSDTSDDWLVTLMINIIILFYTPGSKDPRG